MPATHLQNKRQTRVDHVASLVGRYYAQSGTQLCLGGIVVSDIVERYGTPLFVYDQRVIEQKVQLLRDALPPSFDIFYSIKANPNQAILKVMLDQGCGLEVASGGELFQALRAGGEPSEIIFAGPGKSRAELHAAADAQIREVHIESWEEACCLSEVAKTQQRVVKVGLRVNPVDAAGGAMQMGGKASPFGIDEEELLPTLDATLTLPNLKVVGLHLFMGTQVLDADVLLQQYGRAVRIARQIAARLPHRLETIDFGGGLGTPYFANERELDLNRVREGLIDIESRLRSDPLLKDCRAIVEPGRFLVGESGVYLTRITRLKESRGKTFAFIDGGMHHHLAASGNLGQAIKRNFPVAVAGRIGVPADREVQIVGPLCTPLDCLARNVWLPQITPGDIFAVFQSGAYARTSSPHGFLSHESPAEALVAAGASRLIRRRGEPGDHLRDQLDTIAEGAAAWSS